jgi:DNA-directed RNA polymerase beta subunit
VYKRQVLFRLFGWSSDKKIVDHVLLNMPENFRERAQSILIKAFTAPYSDQFQPLRHIHACGDLLEQLSRVMGPQFKEKFKLQDNDEHYQKVGETIMAQLDMFFLVHMGDTPASRDDKLKVLCYQMNKMLLTFFGLIPPTDRDSYTSKRIHPVGTTFAKIFKTLFHSVIVRGIVSKFGKETRQTQFDKIQIAEIFRSGIAGAKLETELITMISRGEKDEVEIGGQVRKQHFHSQPVSPKNPLNILSTMRNVIITGDAGGRSARATQMRQVHGTALGFIDCVHSPESIKGGLTKNLTLYATITKSWDSAPIIKEILKDSDIKPLNEVTFEDRQTMKLCNVFLNGKWIGFCKNSFDFAEKYRAKRRRGEFPSDASIIWNMLMDEVSFRIDSCRMIRPTFVVYNTIKNPERFTKEELKQPFMQKILFTKEHATLLRQRKITIENDLVPQGIVEYLSVDEMPNCMISADYKTLIDHQFDELKEFTHLDIPATQLGLTSLTCPYAGHNQTTRIIYQTNQAKQTCGMAIRNWPFIPHKELPLQYVSEKPLVRTIYNNFLNPSGINTIVAIMTYGGENQEDSIILNQGAIDRGEFDGCKITYYESILDKSEQFRMPDHTNTKNIRQGANYSKMVEFVDKNGPHPVGTYVPRGTYIEKNDVIIGKSLKVSRISDSRQEEYPFSDVSVIYQDSEPAIVHDIIAHTNEDDKSFIKVVVRKLRPVAIGDKFSSRAGQKGVVSITLPEEDMPVTASGMIPSILMNPHAIPSRMTIGQLYESVTGNWCAAKGIETDATIFRTDNPVADICEELKRMGLDDQGEERLYSGITGDWIHVRIFMGVTYFQRLQKYGIETLYAISTGPTDIITRQPIDGGKAHRGGLRIGDMEKYCLIAHASTKALMEKFQQHSDGITEYLCLRCGKAATVNVELNQYKCQRCGDSAEFGYTAGSWCAKQLVNTVESINIGIQKIPAPREYYDRS